MFSKMLFTKSKALRRTFRAFTLMELLVSIAILGIVAAFVIPNYNRIIERDIEKDIANNLFLIKKAMEVYSATNGNYPGDLADVNQINTTLRLGVISNDSATYSCAGTAVDFTCVGDPDATDTRYAWELWVQRDLVLGINFDPYCPAANCPVCTGPAPAGACPYLY